MTKETKFIVASNLTNAAFLRDQLMQGGGQPVKETTDVVISRFAEFIKLLDKQYPEK